MHISYIDKLLYHVRKEISSLSISIYRRLIFDHVFLFLLQMIGRRCVLLALGILLILVITVNIYFIRIIVENSSQKSQFKNLPLVEENYLPGSSLRKNENSRNFQKSVGEDINEKIKEETRILPSKYFKQNTSYLIVLERLLSELKIMDNAHEDIWSIPSNNVSSICYYIYYL